MTSAKQNTVLNNERNYGIDLLRIITMLMIVILHLSGFGGAGNNLLCSSPNYYLVIFMKTFTYCSVNIYALISGYVGLNSKFRCYKIILLWIEVFFYNVLITSIGFFLSPKTVTLKMLILSVMPLKSSGLWYFTAYFGMFFFTPVFNYMINNTDRKIVKKFIILMILLFCVLPVISNNFKLFSLNYGYSIVWLSVLYIIGGYIKIYKSEKKMNDLTDEQADIRYLIGFLICAIVGLIYYFIIEHLTIRILGHPEYTYSLMYYNSPLVSIQAIFALLFFSKIKIKNKFAAKIITILSASTFGVYAIHTHHIIAQKIITGIYTPPRTISSIKLFFSIIILALAIYLICTLIDIIRIQLFKLLKIDSLSKKISGLLEKIFNRIVKITDKFGV